MTADPTRLDLELAELVEARLAGFDDAGELVRGFGQGLPPELGLAYVSGLAEAAAGWLPVAVGRCRAVGVSWPTVAVAQGLLAPEELVGGDRLVVERAANRVATAWRRAVADDDG